MYTEDDLINSPLEQTYTEGSDSVDIFIYRMPDTHWSLEVQDVFGNSTVWDDLFETDQAALDEFFRTIQEEGIGSLIGEPSKRDIEKVLGPEPMPLSDELTGEELIELDQFLMSDATSDETMLLDSLDGYLTAIVIGPTTLPTSRWYPGIWGSGKDDAPVFDSPDEAMRIMTLIMRHYNSIVASLQYDPDTHEPLFDYFQIEGVDREYVDGEMWAYGFMEGIALCQKDWKALLDDPQGKEWMHPIRLLGDDDLSDEELSLLETPEQREALALQIPESLANIYRFWLPHRQAIHELQLASTYQREQPKVGRNDPCPCGSGKKYKKCCGMAPTIH
jgi:uncharacterized protein